MKIVYLKDCSTRQELKNRYKALARELHPDFGGTTENMIQLNNEFDYLFDRVTTTKQEQSSPETAKQYMEVVQHLIAIPGITIELCGTWLWITGDTKPVKELLKAAGFRFAGKKAAWYWHAGDYKKRSRRKLSLTEIRALYGSEELEKQERAQVC